MATDRTTSWAVDRPVDASPFALPKGWIGRLAGRFMLLTNKQTEQLALLGPKPGSRVLEVGFGPGGLIRQLLRTGATVRGVDPSPEMVTVAGKVNRSAGRRLELRVGTAAETGYPDADFDHVVSVNNIAIWPDLEAGLRELHRVVRPGGTVLISWHGGANPSRLTRALRLPEDKLDRVQSSLEALFGTVTRHELSSQTAFVATR
jgi:ubiquinone/menaquinone biosynthesis C-methylase UbiE